MARAAKALTRARGDVWATLLPLAAELHLAEIVEEARAQPDWDLVLPSRLVFPDSCFPIQVWLRTADEGFVLDVKGDADARVLQAVLSGQWRERETSTERGAEAELARDLLRLGLMAPSAEREAPPRAPGIYRLQHASLLLRSREATVVTDPVWQMVGENRMSARDLSGVDAIAISHSHTDHFSYTSLLQFPRETTILVPRVERPSMLAEDMASVLRAAGFVNVVEASWYSSVRIKDIDVRVLPFLGEQPWVTFPSPVGGFRNAGNTYLFSFEGKRVWTLFDAGQECGGSMTDVATEVRDRFGGVDVVLSNVQEFPWNPGQIDGSGRYLFCFPAEKLADPTTWPRGQSITSGRAGLRRLLSTLEPTCFLPYAHWWHEPGAPVTVMGGRSEGELVAGLVGGCGRTRTGAWTIGQGVSWTGEELRTGPPVTA